MSRCEQKQEDFGWAVGAFELAKKDEYGIRDVVNLFSEGAVQHSVFAEFQKIVKGSCFTTKLIEKLRLPNCSLYKAVTDARREYAIEIEAAFDKILDSEAVLEAFQEYVKNTTEQLVTESGNEEEKAKKMIKTQMVELLCGPQSFSGDMILYFLANIWQRFYADNESAFDNQISLYMSAGACDAGLQGFFSIPDKDLIKKCKLIFRDNESIFSKTFVDRINADYLNFLNPGFEGEKIYDFIKNVYSFLSETGLIKGIIPEAIQVLNNNNNIVKQIYTIRSDLNKFSVFMTDAQKEPYNLAITMLNSMLNSGKVITEDDVNAIIRVTNRLILRPETRSEQKYQHPAQFSEPVLEELKKAERRWYVKRHNKMPLLKRVFNFLFGRWFTTKAGDGGIGKMQSVFEGYQCKPDQPVVMPQAAELNQGAESVSPTLSGGKPTPELPRSPVTPQPDDRASAGALTDAGIWRAPCVVNHSSADECKQCPLTSKS